jgi:hypothetical protein
MKLCSICNISSTNILIINRNGLLKELGFCSNKHVCMSCASYMITQCNFETDMMRWGN